MFPNANPNFRNHFNNVSSQYRNDTFNIINSLLTANATEADDELMTFTECSPNIEVVVNKQGGICIKCNKMFKSRVSLVSHVEKCIGKKFDYINRFGNIKNNKENNKEKGKNNKNSEKSNEKSNEENNEERAVANLKNDMENNSRMRKKKVKIVFVK